MIMQALHQRADVLDTTYCILDIPLLINTAERDRVNRILVVRCEQKERIARIQKRNGWPLEKIEKAMKNQVSDQALLTAADDVLDNDGDIAAIGEQVAELHSVYLLLAQ
jgi:dephospho-CoA kinase